MREFHLAVSVIYINKRKKVKMQRDKEPLGHKMDFLKVPAKIQRMGVTLLEEESGGLGYQNTLVSIFLIFLFIIFKRDPISCKFKQACDFVILFVLKQ